MIPLPSGEKEYPDPPLTTSKVVTAAPCASTIPVTLLSSSSVVKPVLTFLPIGVSVLATATGTFNLRGHDLRGLLGSNWAFRLPASIGVLKKVAVPDSTNDALRNLKHRSSY